jgi:hypothetical protein
MTQAEQLLNATREQIKTAAVRRERLDHAEQFSFSDKSSIQIRKLSGRSAFAANGWHLKSN